MTLKLHCFGESGNSYKAALALELSGLEWEPRPEPLNSSQSTRWVKRPFW